MLLLHILGLASDHIGDRHLVQTLVNRVELPILSVVYGIVGDASLLQGVFIELGMALGMLSYDSLYFVTLIVAIYGPTDTADRPGLDEI